MNRHPTQPRFAGHGPSCASAHKTERMRGLQHVPVAGPDFGESRRLCRDEVGGVTGPDKQTRRVEVPSSMCERNAAVASSNCLRVNCRSRYRRRIAHVTSGMQRAEEYSSTASAVVLKFRESFQRFPVPGRKTGSDWSRGTDFRYHLAPLFDHDDFAAHDLFHNGSSPAV
jgi:hypothetical protein